MASNCRGAACGPGEHMGHDRLDRSPGAPAGGMRKRGARDQALGRSRGGLSTKVHMAVDAMGHPIRFILTGGQAADSPQAIPLLTGIKATRVIADKVLDFIHGQGTAVVIPPKSNRRVVRTYDKDVYKQRNLIERAFNKLKNWRRIATRYDRRSLYFMAALYLASAVTWSN
ncbi:MAG: IS5 family transposase [Armatimonadetes bacterium]|nr:IS5 family transposase [Armatimonadota bacterium]